MSTEEKITLLEETFELEEGTLKPETLLDDIEEYDSIAKLSLIVMFEDEFDKKITSEQIKAFVKVEDILDIMD